MQLLDHEPHFWFLVDDGTDLILDVNCEHGAVGYSFTMTLDDAEKSNFSAKGREYLNDLAQLVQYSAPGVRDSASPYRSRRLSSERIEQVNLYIADWIKSNSRLRY